MKKFLLFALVATFALQCAAQKSFYRNLVKLEVLSPICVASGPDLDYDPQSIVYETDSVRFSFDISSVADYHAGGLSRLPAEVYCVHIVAHNKLEELVKVCWEEATFGGAKLTEVVVSKFGYFSSDAVDTSLEPLDSAEKNVTSSEQIYYKQQRDAYCLNPLFGEIDHKFGRTREYTLVLPLVYEGGKKIYDFTFRVSKFSEEDIDSVIARRKEWKRNIKHVKVGMNVNEAISILGRDPIETYPNVYGTVYRFPYVAFIVDDSGTVTHRGNF